MLKNMKFTTFVAFTLDCSILYLPYITGLLVARPVMKWARFFLLAHIALWRVQRVRNI